MKHFFKSLQLHEVTFFITLILLQSCAADKPIAITEFSAYTYNRLIDTSVSLGKERIYYYNFFLISNYRDNNLTRLKIDSFVVQHVSKNKYSPKTDEIRLSFYKETNKTNLEAIKRNPRELDRYSNQHDIVYYYAVKLNGSTVREKYKNGEVIETTEDLPETPKFKIIKVPDEQ
jgi:hypothetical protein